MGESLLLGVRAVIFDAGNTLVFPDWSRIRSIIGPASPDLPAGTALQRALAELLADADSDPGFLHRLGERKVPTNWHLRGLLERAGVTGPRQDSLVAELDEAHQARHLWSVANPDAAPVLRTLKERGLAVAVISNSEDGRVEDVLRTAGLAAYLDLWVDSHLVGFAKPDPRIFAHAVAAVRVAPAEALYVGDMYTQDVEGARRAGLRSVLFDPLDLRPRADAPRIRSLRELVSTAEVRG